MSNMMHPDCVKSRREVPGANMTSCQWLTCDVLPFSHNDVILSLFDVARQDVNLTLTSVDNGIILNIYKKIWHLHSHGVDMAYRP